jgi:hypothetical protein
MQYATRLPHVMDFTRIRAVDTLFSLLKVRSCALLLACLLFNSHSMQGGIAKIIEYNDHADFPLDNKARLLSDLASPCFPMMINKP